MIYQAKLNSNESLLHQIQENSLSERKELLKHHFQNLKTLDESNNVLQLQLRLQDRDAARNLLNRQDAINEEERRQNWLERTRLTEHLRSIESRESKAKYGEVFQLTPGSSSVELFNSILKHQQILPLATQSTISEQQSLLTNGSSQFSTLFQQSLDRKKQNNIPQLRNKRNLEDEEKVNTNNKFPKSSSGSSSKNMENEDDETQAMKLQKEVLQLKALLDQKCDQLIGMNKELKLPAATMENEEDEDEESYYFENDQQETESNDDKAKGDYLDFMRISNANWK
jgi:hypothetical protein